MITVLYVSIIELMILSDLHTVRNKYSTVRTLRIS
jgi:hypothetical protein